MSGVAMQRETRTGARMTALLLAFMAFVFFAAVIVRHWLW
jgi:hypothetical protein